MEKSFLTKKNELTKVWARAFLRFVKFLVQCGTHLRDRKRSWFMMILENKRETNRKNYIQKLVR